MKAGICLSTEKTITESPSYTRAAAAIQSRGRTSGKDMTFREDVKL